MFRVRLSQLLSIGLVVVTGFFVAEMAEQRLPPRPAAPVAHEAVALPDNSDETVQSWTLIPLPPKRAAGPSRPAVRSVEAERPDPAEARALKKLEALHRAARADGNGVRVFSRAHPLYSYPPSELQTAKTVSPSGTTAAARGAVQPSSADVVLDEKAPSGAHSKAVTGGRKSTDRRRKRHRGRRD